jgi:hypothetical protein
MGLRAKFSNFDALGIGHLGQLVKRLTGTGGAARLSGPANHVNLTSPIVTCTGTISAEAATAANQRDISITLKDDQGDAINYAGMVELILFSTAAMVDFTATGGTTGIAQGSGGNTGKILALVAKKVFRAISSTAGVIACIYTDTGTDAAFLGVRLPNGEVVLIGDLTTA